MVITDHVREISPHEMGLPRRFENLSTPELVQLAIAHREDESRIALSGALIVNTDPDTGRSKDDKYLIRSHNATGIDFGDVNKPLDPIDFSKLCELVDKHFDSRPRLYQQDLSLGADPEHAIAVQAVSENAWSTLFMKNLLRSPIEQRSEGHTYPPLLILHAPSLKLDGEVPGILGNKAIAIDVESGVAIIAGTRYAGEEKKAAFTYAQYVYPRHGIATLHCSANRDEEGNAALFFGLSGTGKTTLSAAANRVLIGDDEHGWSDNGIFNFEGGSYAKVINLSMEKEPGIWSAMHQFGTVLENVEIDTEGNPAFSGSVENMRGAAPLSYFPNADLSGVAGHPGHIFFLTADASGVMPPVARLTREQALYHYASGYTSKLGGTEVGITEPTPEFSACYGGPFLAYPAQTYVALLDEKIKQHAPEMWLINTGWPGGYGKQDRMDIVFTRKIINSILRGEVATRTDPDTLGFAVPRGIAGISQEQLLAENYWSDQQEYIHQARKVEAAFSQNLQKFNGYFSQGVRDSGPHVR